MITQGLRSEYHFLDVCCGCLRAGRHFIEYFDPGHICGFDKIQLLLDAGHALELTEEQRRKRPDLRQIEDFSAEQFGRRFDFAIAQSVFTHLSLPETAACMRGVEPVVVGTLFATFFEQPQDASDDVSLSHRGEIVTFRDKDPFHSRYTELAAVARLLMPSYVG